MGKPLTPSSRSVPETTRGAKVADAPAYPTVEGCRIRALVEADKPILAAAFDLDHRYFDEINGRFIPLDEICTHLPPGNSSDDKFLFAIEQGNEVAGMIDLIRNCPELATWHLGFLYVIERFRGGLGRKLLRGLYPWLRSQGAEALRLGVVEPNAPARHLYSSEGFVFEAMREADPSIKRMRRTLVLRRAL